VNGIAESMKRAIVASWRHHGAKSDAAHPSHGSRRPSEQPGVLLGGSSA
jgi:hypothetical protein